MADFDPDKYLAEKTGATFDPDAYLRAKKSKIQPVPESKALTGPSALAAAGRGFVQGGSLGFGDELGGAVQGGMQFIGAHPMLQRALTGQILTKDKDLILQPATDTAGAAPAPLGAVYDSARDDMRAEDNAALKAHPLAYLGGNIAGAVATAKPVGAIAEALPGLQGTRAARILKLGALLGGAAGAGASTADTPGGVASDALGLSGTQAAVQDIGGGQYGRGALDLLGAGALGGLTAGTAAEVAPTLVRGLGSHLEDFGVGQARRALANLSQGLSTKKALPVESAREALSSGAIIPFGTAEGNARRLTGLRETLGEQLGATIKRLAELGVRAPADPIVNELGALEASSRPNTLNEAVPAAYRRAAQQIIDRTAPDSTLGVDQLEALKRSSQQSARQAYEAMRSSELGDARKKIASALREANERAIQAASEAAPAGSEIPEVADAFGPLKERLARVIPAADLAEKGSMRGGNRSLLGLTGHQVLAEGIASGEPGKMAGNLGAALLNSLVHHMGPSTAATAAYGLGGALRRGASVVPQDVVAQLAAALQRANETSKAKKPEAWIDENGIPHVLVHTGR